MPQDLAALLAVVAALIVGVVSPGPSFVMIVRVAVSSTRSQALAASLGVAVGGMVFGMAALLGLQSVLLAVPSLYVALKLLGGSYLCYLGYMVFKSAKHPLRMSAERYRSRSQLRSFL